MPLHALPNTSNILWNVLFGAIGGAYFLYGRKQHRPVAFACGLALMGYTFFVDNTFAIVAIGAGLCAAPYFIG